jgi:MFS family permease
MGYTAAMLMQIPAGYIADHWGQKNTLILAKICIILSSICYLVAEDFWMFTLGSIFMALGCNAFATGTTSSFLK